MTREQLIIAKQKELIKYLSKLLHSYKYEVIDGNSKWQRLGLELSALESEPEKAECSCNPEVIGSYANCPIHSPDIDLAEMNFNANFEKEAEERKTAEALLDNHKELFGDRWYFTEYLVSLMELYASQSLPEISDADIEKKYPLDIYAIQKILRYPDHLMRLAGDDIDRVVSNHKLLQEGAKWYRDELKRRLI